MFTRRRHAALRREQTIEIELLFIRASVGQFKFRDIGNDEVSSETPGRLKFRVRWCDEEDASAKRKDEKGWMEEGGRREAE